MKNAKNILGFINLFQNTKLPSHDKNFSVKHKE